MSIPLAVQAVLVIPLLLVLALLSGCSLVDRSARLTGRTVSRLVGGAPAAPPREPLYINLQLAMLSDAVVAQIVRATEEALNAARDTRQRESLLRLRLDYASAVWNAASGPNPFANAIDMLVTLAIGRRVFEGSTTAAALGPALEPVLAILAYAERQSEALVQSFLGAAEYQALREAISARETASFEGPELMAVDLEVLLGPAPTRAGGGARGVNLFRILGMDPFAGLDPATREIAESRQFGERVLFNLQRLPFLLRLNGELLMNGVAQDLEVERIVTTLEVASAAMNGIAVTTAALPDRLSLERTRLVADVRAEAERLGTLAHDYRGAFEAVNTAVATANQALLTFGGVVDRLQSADGQPADPGRPFDITEYSHTAANISEAALNLTGLLGRLKDTLDSPGVARVTPQLEAVLEQADARGRRLLYTAFALGCGFIAVTCVAVIVTASILRRLRQGRRAGGIPSNSRPAAT